MESPDRDQLSWFITLKLIQVPEILANLFFNWSDHTLIKELKDRSRLSSLSTQPVVVGFFSNVTTGILAFIVFPSRHVASAYKHGPETQPNP